MLCEPITNCSEVSFAGCKLCADGYMHGYSNDYLKVDYGYCYATETAPNCFAGIESLNKYYCRVCVAGYFVNLDG